MEDVNLGGRPTKYLVSMNKQVYKLCLLGMVDVELADFFNISESTLNEWKLKYPKFSESIKKGKSMPDANVADKLYNRALGYEYKEVTFEKLDGKENLTVTPDAIIMEDQYRKKITIKHQPADTTAQIFWLKNRDPERWRDRHTVENKNTNTNVNYNLEMSKEELEAYNKKLENDC